jgi:DNA topoisomerase-2
MIYSREYLEEDGDSIEPTFYVPTLPLILINGACGIGTGFSTDIPCFNPDDIKSRLLNLVKDEDADIPEMTPWYSCT